MVELGNQPLKNKWVAGWTSRVIIFFKIPILFHWKIGGVHKDHYHGLFQKSPFFSEKWLSIPEKKKKNSKEPRGQPVGFSPVLDHQHSSRNWSPLWNRPVSSEGILGASEFFTSPPWRSKGCWKFCPFGRFFGWAWYIINSVQNGFCRRVVFMINGKCFNEMGKWVRILYNPY